MYNPSMTRQQESQNQVRDRMFKIPLPDKEEEENQKSHRASVSGGEDKTLGKVRGAPAKQLGA